MNRERRTRQWPVSLMLGLFLLLGIWTFLTAVHRTGLTPGDIPAAERTGTATVESCARDPFHMWITWTCRAKVRWDGEQNTFTERVYSVRELAGSVAVQERAVHSRRGRSREVLPLDFPAKSDGALFFVMMMGFPGIGLAVGFFAGTRLARLLPEPPEKQSRGPGKLTLRSRMSSSHDRAKRFNGPRKGR